MGLVPGQVRRFHPEDIPESPKVPHMGWNTIEVHKPHPLLAGIDMAQGFYFLHSYHYECDSADDVIATARPGRDFDAVAGTNRVFGAQFNPERSQHNGNRLTRNIFRRARRCRTWAGIPLRCTNRTRSWRASIWRRGSISSTAIITSATALTT